MKETKQPEALRLADYLADRNRLDITCDEAAAELRRLHALNQELLEALNETLKAHEVGVFMSGSGLNKARAAIAKAQGASNE